jgi:ATP-dependent DNA ligase
MPFLRSPPLHDPRWIYGPKFDGFRGVLYVSGRECYIRAKRGNVLCKFAELARRIKEGRISIRKIGRRRRH